MTCTQVR